jgi:hypothetical protein
MPSQIQSIYDVPVLCLLRNHGAIPLQVLAHHLVSRHGKDATHLLCVVRNLQKRGLLISSPIDPARGRASRRVLEPTFKGYKWLGSGSMANPYGRSEHPRDYQMARATTVLHYLADGHRLVGGLEVYEALRGHALTVARTDFDRVKRAETVKWLTAATGYDMRVEALVAPTGAVTLLLPVYPGLSWTGILKRLTMKRDKAGKQVDEPVRRSALQQVAEVSPLPFLVVAPDANDAKVAERGIIRWSEDVRIPATVTTVPRWMLVGFPHEPVSQAPAAA